MRLSNARIIATLQHCIASAAFQSHSRRSHKAVVQREHRPARYDCNRLLLQCATCVWRRSFVHLATFLRLRPTLVWLLSRPGRRGAHSASGRPRDAAWPTHLLPYSPATCRTRDGAAAGGIIRAYTWRTGICGHGADERNNSVPSTMANCGYLSLLGLYG